MSGLRRSASPGIEETPLGGAFRAAEPMPEPVAEAEKPFRVVKRTRNWFDGEPGIFNQRF
jgi:hypothetical protein